jgi:GxxExxY protein
MMISFEENGIFAQQQVPIEVIFHGKVVGDYKADILVEGQIILELKSHTSIAEVHKIQTLNYLKATNRKLAILLNFGKRELEYKRLVY